MNSGRIVSEDSREIRCSWLLVRLHLGDCAGQRRVLTKALTLKEGHYELHGCAEVKGKLTSLVLVRLEFDLAEIQYPPAGSRHQE